MPLEAAAPGTPGFSRNVEREVAAGRPVKQALAIAYANSGEKKMDRMDAALDAADELARRADAMSRGDESEQTKERHEGKLSQTERKKIGETGSSKREDMPRSVFLKPSERKYPVKEKRDGVWEYDRELLLAAARRARMEGDDDLAREADKIRECEFGAAKADAVRTETIRIGGRSFTIKQTGPKEWRYEAGNMSRNGSGLDSEAARKALIRRLQEDYGK